MAALDPADRLARLRAALPENELDALLVSDRTDIAYLSGFRGSNGLLLITPGEQILITDFRYRSQAAEQAPTFTYHEMPSGQGLADTAAALVNERRPARLGFQSDHVVHSLWAKLSEAIEGDDVLKPTQGVVAELREIKSPAEIDIIRQAARVADETMVHAFDIVEVGMAERDLKAELEHFMVKRGAEKPSFDMIIAGGPHSALPHAPVSDRPLQHGDLLTLDLGAVVNGYCSDLTRTIALGRADDEQRAIYDLVYQAQVAALRSVAPGVKGKDVDAVARTIIEDAGHGDHFGHGLGHGVGMDIHEAPRLSVKGETDLAPGHVVTVEPGVYVEGFGGVRIEDLVVVTDDGCEVLSRCPKPAELMIV